MEIDCCSAYTDLDVLDSGSFVGSKIFWRYLKRLPHCVKLVCLAVYWIIRFLLEIFNDGFSYSCVVLLLLILIYLRELSSGFIRSDHVDFIHSNSSLARAL